MGFFIMKNLYIYSIFLYFCACLQSLPAADIDSLKTINAFYCNNQHDFINQNPDTTLYDNLFVNKKFSHHFAFVHLGYFGAPSKNLHSILPSQNTPFFSFQNISFLQNENFLFINTKKPFTDLSYYTNTRKDLQHEFLSFSHSQNINPKLNVGFNVNVISSKGQYTSQDFSTLGFSLNSNYLGKNYQYAFLYSFSKLRRSENGGIAADSMLNLAETGPKAIPFLIDTAENKYNYHNLFFVQKLYFSILGSRKSVVSHSAHFSSLKKKYYDFESNFYSPGYFSYQNSNDSLYYNSLVNNIKLITGSDSSIVRYSILYQNEINMYSFHSEVDSLYHAGILSGYKSDSTLLLYNNYLKSGIHFLFANAIQFNSEVAYCFHGYKVGESSLKNTLLLRFDSVNSLQLNANIMRLNPDIYYQTFSSNRVAWINQFNATSIQMLSLNFQNSKYMFTAEANLYNLNNYIFMSPFAIPAQYNKNLQLFFISTSGKITWWLFNSLNNISYQKSSNDDVFAVPNLAVRSFNYFDKNINFRRTKGKLNLQIGFSANYFTSYYASTYYPATGYFVNQNNRKIGNYPYFDFFINAKIKNVSFLLKYEHINFGYSGNEYFSAYLYPSDVRMFRVGIRWLFYD